MKTIGLIGGLSWHSTTPYYEVINRLVEEATDGVHNAEMVITSVDNAFVVRLLEKQDHDELAAYLGARARALAAADANFIMMACNSVHVVADAVASATDLPFIHIADAVADDVAGAGHRSVGVLSTAYTRDHAIYDQAFQTRNIRVLHPTTAETQELHEIIYRDLNFANVERGPAVCAVGQGLVDAGADALVLGCTELSLVLNSESLGVPIVDSAVVHATAAARMATSAPK